jgi:hypothetical protein
VGCGERSLARLQHCGHGSFDPEPDRGRAAGASAEHLAVGILDACTAARAAPVDTDHEVTLSRAK